MKRLGLLGLMLISPFMLLAQSKGEIKGRVIDGKSGEAVLGAVINVKPSGVSDQEGKYNTSGYNGEVTFSQVEYGEYDITATFLGYDTLRRSVKLDQPVLELATLVLNERSQKIDMVTLKANAIRTSQSGDTISYNANAFKVSADEAAEGLLAKMPGITVSDGEVEAQGESIKKIYVDGKEFFGEDVKLAVKNIPAEIISNIEVFNKLSDNSQFTGVDDGEGYKAINIVTRQGMNNGSFGKFTAGYAFDDLYQLDVNYNYFTNNHRFSLLTSANNMNLTNFGMQDLMGGKGGREMIGGGGQFTTGGSRDGLATIGSIGLNYTGMFLDNKLQVEGSYFYNQKENVVDKLTNRQYITDESEALRYLDATNQSTTNNYNHRVNAKVEYKPNDNHMIMMRPMFAYQDNDSNTFSFEDNYQSLDGESFEDLNTVTRTTDNLNNSYVVANTLVYRAKLGNMGRSISAMVNGSINKREQITLSDNITALMSDQTEEVVKQNLINGSDSYSTMAHVTYLEPFRNIGHLTFAYKFRYNYSDSDYKVYEWEQEQNMFNPDYDPTSSNIYNSGYATHSIGPGFMYSNADKTMFNANISYQSSSLMKSQEMPITVPADQKYSFDNVTYFMMFYKPFTPTHTLRMYLRSFTNNPSVANLQNVLKDSNPQNVSIGNPDLNPSYRNNLSLRYTHSDVIEGRTFMAMIGGNLENNYIGDSTVLLLNANDSFMLPNGEMLSQYGQFSKPVNLDGSWNVNSAVSYGTPITPIYCNLNLDLGVQYSESPSIINGLANIQHSTNYRAGASLGSNISTNADFTIGYSGGYSTINSNYTLGGSKSNNEYFTQSVSLKFKFTLFNSFTLSGDNTYSQYRGVTDDYNEEYMFCNLYVGKTLFNNNRGEITFGVNDLFDQTETFARNITDTYIENVKSNSIGRYYGFKFVYNLRNFAGKGMSDVELMPSEGRRGMMDGGGMRMH